jgi:hypothetical protein
MKNIFIMLNFKSPPNVEGMVLANNGILYGRK